MYANRKDPLDGEIFFYYSYVKTITASYVCLSSSSPEMLVQLRLMIGEKLPSVSHQWTREDYVAIEI